MMGRDRAGVEAAMAGFTSMLEDDKDSNVRVLLGMSIAFTLDESPSKVRMRVTNIISAWDTHELCLFVRHWSSSFKKNIQPF